MTGPAELSDEQVEDVRRAFMVAMRRDLVELVGAERALRVEWLLACQRDGKLTAAEEAALIMERIDTTMRQLSTTWIDIP